jgi:hypothetical protein
MELVMDITGRQLPMVKDMMLTENQSHINGFLSELDCELQINEMVKQ